MSSEWLEKKGTPWSYRVDAPEMLKDEEAIVINLGNKGSKGTHWVAARKIGGTLLYADPFGTVLKGYPPNELRKDPEIKRIISNRVAWQRPSTGLCGYYSYLFTKALNELPEDTTQEELEESLRDVIGVTH